MSLNRLNAFIQSFRFKIAATYFVLVVVSSVALFGFLYFMLAKTLKEKDAQIIESDYKRFTLAVTEGGARSLESWFKQQSVGADVFVRLLDGNRKTIFEHDPAILPELDERIFRESIDSAPVSQFSRVESPSDREDAVEFYTGRLENGMILQVGKDTDDREDLLEKFRDAFAITLAVALITAILTGLLFSRSILRPVRNLIQTINRVQKGELAARAEVRLSGDEVNELAKFLNAMLDQNSKLIKALRESLDAVAHDLRTPMTRLRATAERALQLPNGNAAQTEALGEVVENTDQVIELLNAIFDMTEADAGALNLKIQKFSIKRLLEGVIDIYSLVAEEKSIVVETSIPKDFEICCDVRIKQAVANLLDNAIKFTPSSSRVEVTATQTESGFSIAISDAGPGISKEEQQKIWDRLYRGDQSRSTRGMGLGLSLVRAIVVAHGGVVRVEPADTNRYPPGSRFEISLPDLKNRCNQG